VGRALTAPLGIAALAIGGGVPWGTALLFMSVGGALHAGYFLVLLRAYRHGELSVVYPVARGTGPVLATAAAIVAFGERPSALGLAGGAIIVLAVLSLARPPSDEQALLSESTVLALLTGCFIATYTIWDKQAVDAQELTPLVYYWGTSLVRAALLSPFALRERERARAVWREHRASVVGVAALSSVAYLLVLYALTLAPVSYVAPAREASVLIAAAMGVQLLGEGDARRRLLAAGAVAVGVIALAIG
jgi:drug/metabolite transporter (DMT)-like permease